MFTCSTGIYSVEKLKVYQFVNIFQTYASGFILLKTKDMSRLTSPYIFEPPVFGTAYITMHIIRVLCAQRMEITSVYPPTHVIKTTDHGKNKSIDFTKFIPE